MNFRILIVTIQLIATTVPHELKALVQTARMKCLL